MPALYVPSVLPSVKQWRELGLKTALVTLIASDGSSPRPIGSQMAIAEDGRAVGNITGGCAEAAIIAEARTRLAQGANGCVRYGAGSPYMDIRLPCGSGIDVYFDVHFTDSCLDELLSAQQRRQPVSLLIDPNRHSSIVRSGFPSLESHEIARAYPPVVRLVIAGKGPLVPILAQMASAADFEVIAFSSEPETLEATARFAAHTEHLATPASFRYAGYDRWTAFVSLFHEHEWEPTILSQALRSECFYVGALGSTRTHEMRVLTLREQGLESSLINRLHAPVGLKLGGKNPPEIALAILAEIVRTQYAPQQT